MQIGCHHFWVCILFAEIKSPQLDIEMETAQPRTRHNLFVFKEDSKYIKRPLNIDKSKTSFSITWAAYLQRNFPFLAVFQKRRPFKPLRKAYCTLSLNGEFQIPTIYRKQVSRALLITRTCMSHWNLAIFQKLGCYSNTWTKTYPKLLPNMNFRGWCLITTNE